MGEIASYVNSATGPALVRCVPAYALSGPLCAQCSCYRVHNVLATHLGPRTSGRRLVWWPSGRPCRSGWEHRALSTSSSHAGLAFPVPLLPPSWIPCPQFHCCIIFPLLSLIWTIGAEHFQFPSFRISICAALGFL